MNVHIYLQDTGVLLFALRRAPLLGSQEGMLCNFPECKPCNFVIALVGLGEEDEPSDKVLRGCEEFLCSVDFFLSKWSLHWASKDAQMVFVQSTQR